MNLLFGILGHYFRERSHITKVFCVISISNRWMEVHFSDVCCPRRLNVLFSKVCVQRFFWTFNYNRLPVESAIRKKTKQKQIRYCTCGLLFKSFLSGPFSHYLVSLDLCGLPTVQRWYQILPRQQNTVQRFKHFRKEKLVELVHTTCLKT